MTKKRVAPVRRLHAKKRTRATINRATISKATVSKATTGKAATSKAIASRPKRRISFKADAWYARAVQRFGIRTGGAAAVAPAAADQPDRHVH